MPTILNWAWLVVLLPFAGFLANGWLSFYRRMPSAREHHWRGLLAASFAMSLALVGAVASTNPAVPYIVKYGTWIATGKLQIDIACRSTSCRRSCCLWLPAWAC